MGIILTVCIAYLIGSIPTAYIFSKLIFKIDIRGWGSSNVGTLNFLRTTGSKRLSLLVLIIDIFKGFSAMWISAELIPANQWVFPALAVISGHIYPVWLKGKGGRGLASLAGIALFLIPEAVAVWWLVFFLIYLLTKKYILGGMLALFIINLLCLFFRSGQLFLILSSASMLVMLHYSGRLKQELHKGIKKKGDNGGS